MERSRMLANQRRYQELSTGRSRKVVCSNGAELDNIREQNDAEIRRFLQKQRADAVRHSSRQQNSLDYGVNQWHKAMDLLTPRDQKAPAVPIFNFVVLTRPCLFSPPKASTWSVPFPPGTAWPS